MVGPTLLDIREHIERLAVADGQYYLRCGRTGDRPVPAADSRFPDRATARVAARATEQYRSALRRYDPQVPYYDLIVCEVTPPRATDRTRERSYEPDGPPATLSEPVVTDTAPTERRDLVEFCHRVAGTVFETLSETGYESVESAVMDVYFEVAETVSDPDELCLCLLESVATELDDRLSPAEQAEVLADAAARMNADTPSSEDDVLGSTLRRLKRRGFLEDYTCSASSPDDGATSVSVQLSGYALSAHGDRLPVLPVTLELCRYHPGRVPQSVEVSAVDNGWQLTFRSDEGTDQGGLVSAPIDGVA